MDRDKDKIARMFGVSSDQVIIPDTMIHQIGNGRTLPKLITKPEIKLAELAWETACTQFRTELEKWLNMQASPNTAEWDEQRQRVFYLAELTREAFSSMMKMNGCPVQMEQSHLLSGESWTDAEWFSSKVKS